MKYMLIAGEASGDLHAADLITAIRSRDPQAEFRFFGGDLMAKAARRAPDLHYDRMNVMGFSEVLRKLPRILGNLKAAKQLIDSFRPDTLILIDYPSFNLKLAKYAHKAGIHTDWYISPKVWAWKEWRVRKIKKYVDSLYSILPFEVPFYQRHDYKVTYVGNPSVKEIDYALGHLPPMRHFIERQGLGDDERPIIALLPGSRKGEIRNNLRLMIEAAKRFPEFRYVVAAAPAIPERFYREVAQDPGLPVVFGCTPTLLKYSRAAVVTSGTATLETALIGTPQVVCYRANGKKLSYKIMEKLLKVKYVSLPNLIIGNQAVPELLVHHCTVDGIARELSPLLQNSPQREWQINSYKAMRRKLGTSVAADYAAELIVDAISRPEPQPADNTDADKPKPSRQRRRRQPQKPDSDSDSRQDASPKQSRKQQQPKPKQEQEQKQQQPKQVQKAEQQETSEQKQEQKQRQPRRRQRPKPESKPESQVDSKPRSEPKPKAEAKPKAEPKPKQQSDPKPKQQPKPAKANGQDGGKNDSRNEGNGSGQNDGQSNGLRRQRRRRQPRPAPKPEKEGNTADTQAEA